MINTANADMPNSIDSWIDEAFSQIKDDYNDFGYNLLTIEEAKQAIKDKLQETVVAVIGEDVETDPNPEIPEGVDETYDIQCYHRVGANDLRAQQRAKAQELLNPPKAL